MNRIIPLSLLCLCAAVGAARAEEDELVVITPHNIHIQEEFEAGFHRYLGRPVHIRWIKQGTSELIQLLDAKDRTDPGKSFGIDVFFGGGMADHLLAASRGYLSSANIDDKVLQPIPKEIGGYHLLDNDKRWFATALSTFGILVNKRGLETNKLPAVHAWADLADPRMESWVVLADPRKSASVQVCYEAVLQQYGWEKGFELLMEMGGNSRLIADSSSGVPNEVGTGNALAGPCIDFYAHARIEQAGSDILGYVLPEGGTAVTPDPISLLRNPPHRKLAEDFIAFTLSDAGQQLWVLPPETSGGPLKHNLYRTSVRPDLFERFRVSIPADRFFDYTQAKPMEKFDPSLHSARLLLVSELMGAAIVDQHDDLVRAWRALIAAGFPEDAMAEWRRMPVSEEKTGEVAAKLNEGGRTTRDLVRDWRRFYREKYDRVRELAQR